MKSNTKFIAPALMALSVFFYSQAFAGTINADEPVIVQNEDDQSGDSADCDCNNNIGDPNGDGNHGGGTKYHRNSGGDSWNYGAANITCVINGQIFRVRSTRECYVSVNYGGQRQVYRGYKKSRRVMISGGVQGGYAGGKNGGGYAYGGGYTYDGGYSYAPQPIIRYYKPASRAAVMQTERRARRAARAQMSYGFVAQGGYAMQGGYAYGGGYQMQGGYAMQGGYGQKHRKHRRVRYAQPMYMPAPAYDAGYVVHYGPTISKDGGY